MRLFGGRNGLEGLVEVYQNGRWATICDDTWSEEDARVVCRELRLPHTDVRVSETLQFGPGFAYTWLTDASCTGSEDEFLDCARVGWRAQNRICGEHEDASAGVICAGIFDFHAWSGFFGLSFMYSPSMKSLLGVTEFHSFIHS